MSEIEAGTKAPTPEPVSLIWPNVITAVGIGALVTIMTAHFDGLVHGFALGAVAFGVQRQNQANQAGLGTIPASSALQIAALIAGLVVSYLAVSMRDEATRQRIAEDLDALNYANLADVEVDGSTLMIRTLGCSEPWLREQRVRLRSSLASGHFSSIACRVGDSDPVIRVSAE